MTLTKYGLKQISRPVHIHRVGKWILSLDGRSYKVTLQGVDIGRSGELWLLLQSIPISNEDIKKFAGACEI